MYFKQEKGTGARLVFLLLVNVLTLIIVNAEDRMVLSENSNALAVIQVPDKKCPPIVSFAAEELQKYLNKITGASFSVAKGIAPVEKNSLRIVLGDCEDARNAGLSVNTLSPDNFYIWHQGNTLFICGQDDPVANIDAVLHFNDNIKSWGTLLAAYYFLEEYCGVSWLFPGDFGEYIPENKNLSLPSVRKCVKPGMDMRIGSLGKYKDFAEMYGYTPAELDKANRLFLLRLRFSSWRMAKSHYLGSEGSASRWVNAHPEYFAMGPDGKRQTKFIAKQGWWLDFTNPDLAHEVALDAIAYFNGKPASARWLPDSQYLFGFRKESLAINPGDTPVSSYSPECAKYKDVDGSFSELAWKYYKQVADEVAKECPGKILSVWSYADYSSLPKSLAKAPENLRIYVVSSGPFDWIHNEKRGKEEKRLNDWYAFSGHKLYIWVNGCLRGCRYQILEGVPSPVISEIGPWLKFSAPYINGVYYTDYCAEGLFESANIYLVYHLLWNPEADAKKITDDFYAKAYGPASGAIRGIEEKCGDIWKNNIMTSKFKDGALMMGDVNTIPTKMEIWENIYNEKVIDELKKLMADAVILARGTPFEKRVELFNKYYLNKILNTRDEYLKIVNASNDMLIPALKTSDSMNIDGKLNEAAWTKCTLASMVSIKDNEKLKVETEVRLLYDEKNLYVGFKCHEPLTAKLCTTWAKKHDDFNIWKDDEVEVFLDPLSSRKEYYQILANAAGQFADLKFIDRNNDIKWNPDVKTAAFVDKDFWSLEMSISFNSMNVKTPAPGERWRGNFCRARNLNISEGDVKQLLSWSRFIKDGFNNPSGFGIVLFTDTEVPADGNVLINGNFENGLKGWGGPSIYLDSDIRWNGFKSARLERKDEGSVQSSFLQRFPEKIKANTDYVLTYYMKTEDVTPLKDKNSRFSGAGVQLFLGGKAWHPCPDRFVTGTTEWRKYAVKINSTKDAAASPTVSFTLRDATGRAWIDDVRLVPFE